MTVSTLIANMGGLLGLCMGLSLVSLVEIAFYLVKFIMSVRSVLSVPIKIK